MHASANENYETMRTTQALTRVNHQMNELMWCSITDITKLRRLL